MLKCSQRGSHLTLSLDFSQITQTSLSGEGKKSQKLKEEYFHWWNQQLSKEGGGSFYTILQKLDVGNYPVEIGTSGFRIRTSGF
jgi:hypothetical protein